MKRTLTRLAAGLLIGGAAFSGCSSDVHLLTNPKKSRLEGVAHYNRGAYGDAAGSFRNTVRQEPRDFRAHYYLGLSYEALGAYQQAIQAYKTGIASMTTTLQGQDAIDFRQRIMNRLAALIAAGDQQDAEKELLQQQASDASLAAERRAEAYFLLAKIHRYRGDADSAITAYAGGMELNFRDYWLQKEAGIYMLQAGQKQQANAPLARAYKINTRDAELNAAIDQAGGIARTRDVEPLSEPVAPPVADLHIGESQQVRPVPPALEKQ
jgi:tetratricopeptide (TPR) repeat protein